MGIKGLRKLLKTKAILSVNQVKLSKFTGKAVAIDCSSYMYQFRYNAERKGKGPHLRGFYEMIVALRQHSIIPIFVFDGKPPAEKKDELDKRQAVTNTRNDEINIIQKNIDTILAGRTIYDDTITQSEAAGIIKLQKSLSGKKKNQIKVGGQQFSEAITLFTYAGIPCLKSSGEADFLCVKLCKDGIASAVLSEDMDILTHGAEYLITGINDNPFRKEGLVTEYCLSSALKGLDVDMNQFVDICILCKCDYSSKINGVAGITAINLIKKHGNIDKILSLIDSGKLNNTVQDKFNYIRARELFKSSDSMNYLLDDVHLSKTNTIKLTKFLLDSTNYTKGTLLKKIDICKQSRYKQKFAGSRTVSKIILKKNLNVSETINKPTMTLKRKIILKKKH
jgi:flap endonuclease-1